MVIEPVAEKRYFNLVPELVERKRDLNLVPEPVKGRSDFNLVPELVERKRDLNLVPEPVGGRSDFNLVPEPVEGYKAKPSPSRRLFAVRRVRREEPDLSPPSTSSGTNKCNLSQHILLTC